MQHYVSAFEYRWKVEHKDGFPLVVFVVHDPDRKRFVETTMKSQAEPRLFRCVLFSEAVGELA